MHVEGALELFLLVHYVVVRPVPYRLAATLVPLQVVALLSVAQVATLKLVGRTTLVTDGRIVDRC